MRCWSVTGVQTCALPIYDSIETVFLMADVSLQPIASRLVKEIAIYGGEIHKFVPPTVCAEVGQRVQEIGLKGDQ